MSARHFSLAALVVAAACFGARSASACTCAVPVSALAKLDRSRAVFLGEVISDRVVDVNPLPEQAYTFRTSAAWKGVTSRLVEIGVQGNGCATSFTPGEEYLIFAAADIDPSAIGRRPEVDDRLIHPTLFTSACSGNLAFQHAGAALAELGEPVWTNDVDVRSWLNDELLESSQRGDTTRVNAMILAGHDVNAKDRETHRTALIAAAAGGHVHTMQVLLRAGASADATARGRTALSEAVLGGHPAAVDLLLGHDSSVDDESVVNAAERGSPEMMTQLLRAGGTPEAVSRKGWTALTVASRSGRIRVVGILLDFGADINLAADRFRTATPLEVALASGHDDIARLLLDRGSRIRDRAFEAALLVTDQLWTQLERTRARQGTDPIEIGAATLNRAVRTGDVRLLERLIVLRPDLHAADVMDAPLPLAAGLGHSEMVEALLDAGADVDHVHGLRSALCDAAESGDVAMVRLLIERGADVNVGGSFDSPLAAAARSGSVPAIDLLLIAGANIDGFAPGGGSTALNEAIGHEHASLVSHLLERGADPSVQSAVCRASGRGRLDLVDVLVASGSPSGGPECDLIASAAEEGQIQTVTGLLDRGVRPDPNSEALHQAVRRGHTEVARILVERVGMSVNTSIGLLDAYLLNEAVDSGSPEMVRLLIEAGAEVNPRGRRDDTPLLRAVFESGRNVLYRRQRRREDPGWLDPRVAIVGLLVEAGAALDVVDRRGKTALEIAREARDTDVLAILER